MSLVIRVMITPAFSSVKKSSDSRCRWVKTSHPQVVHHPRRQPSGDPDLESLGQAGEHHGRPVGRGRPDDDAEMALDDAVVDRDVGEIRARLLDHAHHDHEQERQQ